MATDPGSDRPLGDHVPAIALTLGVSLDVVAPDFGALRLPPGHGVADRIARMLEIDAGFELVIVHRDCEASSRQARLDEIGSATASAGINWPCIPIVPIRMTEAWLLIDEVAIRAVAGRPSGAEPLDLPPLNRVEAVPDAKSELRNALRIASGLRGRRLRGFDRDFGQHRRLLLERLDRAGPVRGLTSWRDLEQDISSAMDELGRG